MPKTRKPLDEPKESGIPFDRATFLAEAAALLPTAAKVAGDPWPAEENWEYFLRIVLVYLEEGMGITPNRIADAVASCRGSADFFEPEFDRKLSETMANAKRQALAK